MPRSVDECPTSAAAFFVGWHNLDRANQSPETVRRDEIDVGFQRSTRDAYIQRLAARQLVRVDGRGEVRASETLFS